MKYVNSYGMLYKITDKEYKKVMIDIADGESYELSQNKCLGVLDIELAKITKNNAIVELKKLQTKLTKRAK